MVGAGAFIPELRRLLLSVVATGTRAGEDLVASGAGARAVLESLLAVTK